MYPKTWPVRVLVVAAWACLTLATGGTARAEAQAQAAGTPIPVPNLAEVRDALLDVDLPAVVGALLRPLGVGSGQGVDPPGAPPGASTGAAPASHVPRANSGKRRSQTVMRAPARQVSSRPSSRSRPEPGRKAASAQRPGRRRVGAADLPSGATPSRAEGTGSAGQDSGGTGGRSPIERVTDVVEAIPKPLLAAVGALALLAVLMAARSAINTVRARRLHRAGKELQADVGALQKALLPAVPDRVGDVALSVAWRPADGPAAGGDFHDIFALQNGRLGVIVGDVSGHGRAALAPTALVHYTVRAHLESGLAPRAVLSLTDEVIGEKLGGSFATVLAAVFDPADSTLTYATAGHPAPIVLGGHDHAVAALTPAPIGIGPPSGGRQTRISIVRGSEICFFTDGLIDARREEGGLLGREGLADVLGELGAQHDANDVLDRLAARAASGGDDITTCLIRPLDASGGGQVVEELEIGQALEHPEDLTRLLTDCGLDPDEAQNAIEASQARSATATPSVLRVHKSQSGTSWETARDDAAPGPASARSTEAWTSQRRAVRSSSVCSPTTQPL
jgi:Stage II sporulation protein E (SpoIIE)